MKASREMDALVAQKIMGWEMVTESEYGLCWKVPQPDGRFEFLSDESAPHYSTNMMAAWLVVEKLSDTHGFFLGKHGTPGRPPWCCRFGAETAVTEGHSAPLTICVAALKAFGVKTPD
jgi:hypothetical protein